MQVKEKPVLKIGQLANGTRFRFSEIRHYRNLTVKRGTPSGTHISGERLEDGKWIKLNDPYVVSNESQVFIEREEKMENVEQEQVKKEKTTSATVEGVKEEKKNPETDQKFPDGEFTVKIFAEFANIKIPTANVRLQRAVADGILTKLGTKPSNGKKGKPAIWFKRT